MKQLEEFQAQFQKEWLQFASKYQYDPDFGYLIPDDHEIKCFSIEPLRKILDILPELNKTGKIIQAVQSLEAIELKEPYSFKDMVILHDTTAMIVQSYFLEKCKTTNQQDIRIPSTLGEPLYISSEFLKCSPGNITVFEYNWKINHQRYKTDPFDLTYQDIELKWYFTGEKEEEANFFKLNFIGSFYLWKIVKQISFANYLARHGPWLENEIIKKLNKAEKYWQKITEQNTKLFSMNDIYFSKRLRPFISGFKNLYFQKVDKRLSAQKGNAGFDPSYQLFEGLFGISYKVHNPQFQVIRKEMRKVMAEIHNKSIEYGEQNCDIRKYCMLSQPLIEAYNNVLNNEIKFSRLHNELIMKYIRQFTPGVQNQPPLSFVLGKLQALEKNLLQAPKVIDEK